MRTFMVAALVAAVFAQDALSPCATAREEALAKEDPALFVPECLPDGSFAQQQCTDISEDEEECWCVDVTGQKLDVDVSECEMCSLMYKAMVAQEADDMYLPDCDDDGSFASIQCFGEDCFCCDAWTGQLDADLTLCQDDDEDEDDDDDEDESCFEEYELGLEKGDLWLPTCNDDGTYAARQCFETTCYCYDADTGDLTPDLTACPVEEDDQTTEGTQEATEDNEEATDANEEATEATDANVETTENNEEATEATDANVETTEDNEEATEAAEQMIGDDVATDDDDEEDEDEDEEEEGFSVGPSVAGAAILGVAMVGIASFVVVKRRSQEPDASAYTMQV